MITTNSNFHRVSSRRAGAALLLCVFVVAVTSLLVLMIMDNETSQFAALRNSIDYERATYLAGAAVYHALAQVEADAGWRGTVTDGAYPADNTYSATVVDGVDENIIVTGSGVAGGVTRRLEITLTTGN